MDADDPGGPQAGGDGFVLWEGWMFGAVMYPVAVEHIRDNPAANDNDA